jgi:hypothetical protein
MCKKELWCYTEECDEISTNQFIETDCADRVD